TGGAPQTASAALPWRSLVGAIACVTVFEITLGFTFPLLTLLLEARKVDETIIGLNAAMTPLGILLMGPFIPALTRRFGARPVAISAAFAVGTLLLLLKTFSTLPSWFVLRLMLGASGGILFTISEAWVVRFAEGPNRAKILAVYASVLSGGFAVGAFMIPFTGIHGWLPFAIAAGCALIATLPILMIASPDAPAEDGEHMTFWAFLPRAPVLLCAVGVFAVFDAVALAFFPIYALRVGLDLDTASFALGVLIAGNVFLQLPLGWLADTWSRIGTMIGCALVTALFCTLLPMTMGTIFMWPVLVVMGTAGFGVYTVALALLGERFSGQALVAGAAAFAAMWGAGAIIGPPAAGGVIKWFGVEALPYFLGLIYLVYGLAFIVRQWTRRDMN
ncbi:MAG: MFS transporter, partial [Hyphomicrobiales bacterium]